MHTPFKEEGILEIKTLVGILGIILSSAVLGAFVTNANAISLKRKELIAGATKSALKRVEMYYRVLRRTPDLSDAVAIRDSFHVVQEENDYYKALLSVESVWLGYSYGRFIEALKGITLRLTQDAWDNTPYGPGGKLQDVKHPDVKRYVDQFTLDSKRFFNPFMRTLMRIKYMLRKHIKSDGYESK